MISGTCKRENAVRHASLISTVVDACNSRAAMIPGSRLISLASDGESRRGAALAQLTQKKSLPQSSNIFHLLGHLKLFNTLVGDDDITCDKDYKHVFKRLRNLLLRDKGTMVNGIHITPSVLSWHLRADGMPAHKIGYLLNPADKQDVTLVFTLLHAIWSLRSPEPTDRPGFAAAREALKILGSLSIDQVVCVDSKHCNCTGGRYT